MKRVASDDIHPPKSTKLHRSDVFDTQPERNPNDILDNGLEDDSGYIVCKCFMTWRPTTKHKAIIESTGFGSRLRFDVEFAGSCAEFFSDIELKAQDEFLLALRSAQVEKSAKPSRLCTIPLKLVYEEGVTIKFTKRQGPCTIVDTWQLKEKAEKFEDSWFLPVDYIENAELPFAASPPREQYQPTSRSSPPSMPGDSLPYIATVNTTERPLVIPMQSQEAQAPKILRKERRALLKKARALRQGSASTSAKQTVASASDNVHAETTALPTIHQRTLSPIRTAPTPDQSSPHPPNNKIVACLTDQTTPEVLSPHTAGLVTPTGQRYHPLANVSNLTLFNAIGVVVQASAPKKTSTGGSEIKPSN
ncbi:hypothetical protein C0991_002408 [Blastosporella zonata]|nr:hypothetical protein C0991_002408 [Blastosporella zonata]